MTFRTTCLALSACLVTFTSCSMLEDFGKPSKESPTPTHESYLQGGPSTDIELGNDERTLLEDYKSLNDTRIQLETQLGEMRAENEQLRTQLAQTEQERDEYRNQLAGSEKESERVSQRSRDLEAKVLALTIEKTMLEQEQIRFRITSLRSQYDQLISGSSAGGTPKTPSVGSRP